MRMNMPGLRPIAHLLSDPSITEIMINGPRILHIERDGKFEQIKSVFRTPDELSLLVEHILHGSGRRVTALTPFVDTRLADGSRVNIVVAPVALDGSIVTIRKHSPTVTNIQDLVNLGTLTSRMAWLLSAGVQAKLNIIFSGAAGSGKTTALSALSAFIPVHERVITIEDTAELKLQQPHVVRMECRPPTSLDQVGHVTMEMLLKNSLRMRPNRILVGEIRGSEVVDMLHAMTTGHDGCMAVMHASTPTDALSRLELMVLSKGYQLPLSAIHRQIAGAVDLIVQHVQHIDGTRRISHITSVEAGDDTEVELRDVFRHEVRGVSADGVIQGQHVCTGHQPGFLEKFRRANVELPPQLFAAGDDA